MSERPEGYTWRPLGMDDLRSVHEPEALGETRTRWMKEPDPDVAPSRAAAAAEGAPLSPLTAPPAAAVPLPTADDPRMHRVLAVQNVSRNCLVCGTENPAGLGARFYELESGDLAGVFRPTEKHQGYPGRLHGGISSAILDETIGRAISVLHPHTWGVTVELTLRFRLPVPLDSEVRAIGRITKDSSRLFEGTGEIVLADGAVAVEAKGKYLKMPVERIVGKGFDESQWFASDEPSPGEVKI